MGAGRAILRGIKLAAYVFAGLLVCLVAYNIVTSPSERSPDSAGPEVFADSQSGGATPMVPPPPPLPGQAKSTAGPRRAAKANQVPETRDAVRIREVDPEEGTAGTLENGVPGGTLAEAPAAANSSDAPVGIVIVRPPLRPPQENRGMRWIKAVGRALRIGGD